MSFNFNNSFFFIRKNNYYVDCYRNFFKIILSNY